MNTIRDLEFKVVDYTAMCSCGWEHYSPLLKWIKEAVNGHLKLHKKAAVAIDRNVGEEIDDTFKTIWLKK